MVSLIMRICSGNVNQALGCLEEALQAHKSHLIKVLELRDRVAEGRAYGNLGNVQCAMGHFTRAVKLHDQVIHYRSTACSVERCFIV